jgi:hypothetical protein
LHRGVVGAVSEDDDVLGEPDSETGGDDGVGWMGQVISIYPYVSLIFHWKWGSKAGKRLLLGRIYIKIKRLIWSDPKGWKIRSQPKG